MPAQIGRYSRVASIRVLADRGSWAVCGDSAGGRLFDKRGGKLCVCYTRANQWAWSIKWSLPVHSGW